MLHPGDPGVLFMFVFLLLFTFVELRLIPDMLQYLCVNSYNEKALEMAAIYQKQRAIIGAPEFFFLIILSFEKYIGWGITK